MLAFSEIAKISNCSSMMFMILQGLLMENPANKNCSTLISKFRSALADSTPFRLSVAIV